MSGLGFSDQQVAQALTNASVKYQVPLPTLLGVFGQETGFGTNVTTSSAGAVGAFQFTAPDKGTGVAYPMTNSPTLSQFGQQADAAAAYLHQLYVNNGSWDKALRAYSGNGYGLAQVQAQETKAPQGLISALGTAIVSEPSGVNVPGVTPGPASPAGVYNTAKNAVNSIPAAISNAVSTVTGDAKYAAVLAGVIALGVMLIYKAFSGSSRPRIIPVPA